MLGSKKIETCWIYGRTFRLEKDMVGTYYHHRVIVRELASSVVEYASGPRLGQANLYLILLRH
jgi:hypothetical protein